MALRLRAWPGQCWKVTRPQGRCPAGCAAKPVARGYLLTRMRQVMSKAAPQREVRQHPRQRRLCWKNDTSWTRGACRRFHSRRQLRRIQPPHRTLQRGRRIGRYSAAERYSAASAVTAAAADDLDAGAGTAGGCRERERC
eukprot:364533-Chlamydomonas_euryale.AAC.9